MIEDDGADVAVISRLLGRVRDLEIELAVEYQADSGIRKAVEDPPDCILLDYRLGNTDGLDVLATLHAEIPDVPVVFVTGEGNEYVAIEALRRGAQEYLVKSSITSNSLKQALQTSMRAAQQQKALRRQRRELEEFVSVVAHDLQQPLCAVKGNIELVRDFYADKLDGPGMEFIESGIRMTTRMSGMIDSLLSYARAGRPQQMQHPVDLNRVAEQVRSSLGELIRSRSARVEFDQLPTAVGDEVSIHQLLQNLVANGIKFSEDEPHIEITGAVEEGECVVQVRDHGIGIPPDQTDTIFAPFKRLHSRKRFEGSGIGLATCRRIVENHGGRIGVESTLGEGSIFWFALPARAEKSGHGPSVLIADSESDVVQQITAALELDGCEVFSASSSGDAANFLEQTPVDLVIADVGLAEDNGVDLVRRLHTAMGSPPVLAMSGGNDRESPGSLLARAREAGAEGVLPKPLDIDRLIMAVHKLTDNPTAALDSESPVGGDGVTPPRQLTPTP